MNGTGDDRSDWPRPRRVKRALLFSTQSSEPQRLVGTSLTARPPHHPHHNQHNDIITSIMIPTRQRDWLRIKQKFDRTQCHLMYNTRDYNHLSTCPAEKSDHLKNSTKHIQANRVMELVR